MGVFKNQCGWPLFKNNKRKLLAQTDGWQIFPNISIDIAIITPFFLITQLGIRSAIKNWK